MNPADRHDAVDLFFGLLIGICLVGAGALMLANGSRGAPLGALVVAMGLGLLVTAMVNRLRR